MQQLPGKEEIYSLKLSCVVASTVRFHFFVTFMEGYDYQSRSNDFAGKGLEDSSQLCAYITHNIC